MPKPVLSLLLLILCTSLFLGGPESWVRVHVAGIFTEAGKIYIIHFRAGIYRFFSMYQQKYTLSRLEQTLAEFFMDAAKIYTIYYRPGNCKILYT